MASVKAPGVSWVKDLERECSMHRELGGQLISMNSFIHQQLFSEHLLCVGTGLRTGERPRNKIATLPLLPSCSPGGCILVGDRQGGDRK